MRKALALLVGLAACPTGASSAPGPGGLRIIGAPSAAVEERIRAVAADARDRLARDLGVEPPEAFEVRVVADRRAMRAITGDTLGEEVLAVAVPARRLVVLDRMSLVPGTRDALAPALRHELVHLALGRFARPGTDRRPVPLWFEEGVATVFGARVLALEDRELSLRAAAGTLLPLDALGESFPREAAPMRLAYLEAESAVRYLRERWGRGAPRRVLARLRRGGSFEAALCAETGIKLAEFEAAWARELGRWERIAGMFVSQRAIFVYAAAVAAVAYALDRRRRRRRLARAEDAAGDASRGGGQAA